MSRCFMRTTAGEKLGPCPLCDGFTYRGEHGPWRQQTVPVGDWTIVADESPEGSWDVYAQHRGGDRMPAGHNMHREPEKEMLRLVGVIDWPGFQTRRLA